VRTRLKTMVLSERIEADCARFHFFLPVLISILTKAILEDLNAKEISEFISTALSKLIFFMNAQCFSVASIKVIGEIKMLLRQFFKLLIHDFCLYSTQTNFNSTSSNPTRHIEIDSVVSDIQQIHRTMVELFDDFEMQPSIVLDFGRCWLSNSARWQLRTQRQLMGLRLRPSGLKLLLGLWDEIDLETASNKSKISSPVIAEEDDKQFVDLTLALSGGVKTAAKRKRRSGKRIAGIMDSQAPAAKIRRRRLKKLDPASVFDVPRRFKLPYQRDLIMVFHQTLARVKIIDREMPAFDKRSEYCLWSARFSCGKRKLAFIGCNSNPTVDISSIFL